MLHSHNKNYSLEIVSHHHEHTGRVLRKYAVDGMDTIGAWNSEPFEIRFTNHTRGKVQVKLSVDGTDILTGDLADTQITKDMWVVQSYGTLSLKAWPETNNGGASFVFTTADGGVGTHLHGDQSNRGVIAAAVYVEDHKESERLSRNIKRKRFSYKCSNIEYDLSDSGGLRSFASLDARVPAAESSTSLCDSFDSERSVDDSLTLGDLKELVAVGAGEQVAQNISYVQGLIKPVFSEIVKVKYLWWDELASKLKGASEINQTGFPGDHKIMSLGSTPRLKAFDNRRSSFKKSAPIFSRF